MKERAAALELDMVAKSFIAKVPQHLFSKKNIISGKLDHDKGDLLLGTAAFVATNQLYQMRLEVRKDIRVASISLQIWIDAENIPIMNIE